MRIYMLFIDESGPPVIRQMPTDIGVVSIHGQRYWLLPATPIGEKPDREEGENIERQVVDLVAGGHYSIGRIARELGISVHNVKAIIQERNLVSPAEGLRKKFRVVLEEAGDKGVSPSTFGKIAGSQHRAGPILKSMRHHGEVKREGLNWVRI